MFLLTYLTGPSHDSLCVSYAAPGSATFRLEPWDIAVPILLVELVNKDIDLVDIVDVVNVRGGRELSNQASFGGLV